MSTSFATKALCLAVASACLACCSRLPEAPAVPEERTVAFTTAAEPDGGTKSALFDDAALSRLVSVTIYGVTESGFWKKAFLRSADGATVSGSFRFPAGVPVDFYVFANMGDVNLPALPGEPPVFERFSFLLSPSADLLRTGFPMAGTGHFSGSGGSVSIPLRRLFAKVEVTIDKKGLTGGTTPVLLSEHLYLRQASRRLRPFASSMATRVSDLFDAPFDSHIFTAADESDLSHVKIGLYVPENSQTRPELATYIEYQGNKDGSADGVDGTVVYRGYLGSVKRNTRYSAQLSLTWDGLLWRADGWTIDAGGVTDGRRLVLSSSEDSHLEINSLGKLKRSSAKSVYVSFSRDGGASWVRGAKDIDDWPYGWDFYVDGVKQATGTAGQAAGAIGWSYDGSASGDRLTVTPGQKADLRTTHTLQVKSADGKVASNVVTFDVSAPLGLKWDAGAPGYVAQRGRLVATQLDKPSATVEYTVTGGSELVRLSAAANRQSQMVNILGAGEVTVLATCEETGQDEEITFRVAAPQLRLNATACYVNPDGAEARTGATGLSGSSISASYSGASGTLSRRVTSATATAVGSYLAADLYDELLAFRPSVTSPLLETSCPSGYGTITLHAKALHAGGDSYPDAAGTTIGYLSVAPKAAAAGISPARATVRSVNPFSAFPSSVTLNTAKDIQDFSVLSQVLGGYSTNTYSTTLPTIQAGSSYYGVAAMLQGDTGMNSELSGLFSRSGSTVSWSSVTLARTQRKAGTFALYGYVENRYSHERLYSAAPFYRGRLFLHGAVVARGVADMVSQTMEVYTDYLGDASAYTADGLGAAWPDVRTTHTNRQYDIEWAWEWDGMALHGGSCTVQDAHNTNAQRVMERGGLLFKVHDDCWYQHSNHEWEPDWHECLFTGPNTDGGARMEFMPAPGDPDKKSYKNYSEGRLKYINKDLMYIHPDGSETHTYNGISGCGYYPMHLSQWIMNRIL